MAAEAAADFRERDDQAWNGAGIHALRRLGGRGKSVAYMREYPSPIVVVGCELTGVSAVRASNITPALHLPLYNTHAVRESNLNSRKASFDKEKSTVCWQNTIIFSTIA